MRKAIERLIGQDIPQAPPHGFNQYMREEAARYPQEEVPPPPVDKRNSAVKLVARLKRDDPELAERVVKGELTANAAARQKGWRKPRILVSSPERTAESLRKHMPAEARQALARLFLED
jgi:hypothetical protein